jgi:phytoene dehydrogenase-like protein
VVVGAGLAGLACARTLQGAGFDVVVLEGSDGVGGRVRSDVVDGYVLDRGFQVLLGAYPEARSVLDYERLDLRPFERGAVVRSQGAFHTLLDPTRHPLSALDTLTNPVGTLADKMAIAWLGLRGTRWPGDGPSGGADRSTEAWLREEGLSPGVIHDFLGPLFAGTLLDAELGSSARQAQFIWRSLVVGDSAVPASGMQAIPDQLAAALRPGTVRLRQAVRAVQPAASAGAALSVIGHDGSRQLASAVVVATDGRAAAALLPGQVTYAGGQAVGCWWFAAQRAPVSTSAIVLNGDGPDGPRGGPVNNLAVMSNVSPTYAPPGRALIAVSVLPQQTQPEAGTETAAPSGQPDLFEAARSSGTEAAVRAQLRGWFGSEVDRWTLLRSDWIPDAQPSQPPGSLADPRRPVRLGAGCYVCGDHRDNASIQGALVSGRRAAEAVITDLWRS